MKLISTVYLSRELEFTINIQPRTGTNQQPENTKPDDSPLVVRHTSRVGTTSLIYNPSVSLIIRPRQWNDRLKSAIIPVTMFYRFIAALSNVYQALDDHLYTVNRGVMYLDQKLAQKAARKLTIYHSTVSLMPTICKEKTGIDSYIETKGIAIIVDSQTLGGITHAEALSLYEILDHMDITHYTLTASLLDQVSRIDYSTELIIDKLDQIIKLINLGDIKKPSTSSTKNTGFEDLTMNRYNG